MAKKAKPKRLPAPAAPTPTPLPTPPEIPSSNRWSEIFAIDTRSLGVFRIVLGLFVIVDLAMRSTDITVFYSDWGVLPRGARILDYEVTDTNGQKNWLSLYMISGGLWFQWLMFAVSAFFAFLLMVGYRTRFAAIASFVLNASLQSRTPFILDGGDNLMRLSLFWGIFLPLNARFSVDRFLRPESAGQVRIANFAGFAYITQVMYVYSFGALQKSDPIWTTDYTALYYAASLECFSTRLGDGLLEYPVLLKLLTFSAWWLEMIGPLLLLIPYYRGYFRLGVVLAFWSFHIGTAVTLHLSLFPFIGCMIWIPLLPPEIWERDRWPGRWLVPPLERRLQPVIDFGHRFLRGAVDYLKNPERCDYRPGRFAFGFLVFVWLYVFLWNLREVWPKTLETVMPAAETNFVGRGLRIDQDWKLFAPAPSRDDGWYVMKGVLRDGTEVNLWEPDRPLTWEKPSSVAESYVNRRWRKYLMNLWSSDYERFRKYFAYWLAVHWSEAQPPDRPPSRYVQRVEIHLMSVKTQAPGQPRPKPKDELLWAQPMGQ